MIIVIGLVILIAAVVAGVAGVLSNSGSGHALTHPFAVFGYHVTGSTGTLFLYGIVVGALGLLGLSLLLAGARRTSRHLYDYLESAVFAVCHREPGPGERAADAVGNRRRPERRGQLPGRRTWGHSAPLVLHRAAGRGRFLDRSEITGQMELRWHGAHPLKGCSPGLPLSSPLTLRCSLSSPARADQNASLRDATQETSPCAGLAGPSGGGTVEQVRSCRVGPGGGLVAPDPGDVSPERCARETPRRTERRTEQHPAFVPCRPAAPQLQTGCLLPSIRRRLAFTHWRCRYERWACSTAGPATTG